MPLSTQAPFFSERGIDEISSLTHSVIDSMNKWINEPII